MDKIKRLERVSELRRNQEHKAGRQLTEDREKQAGKEQLLQQLLQYQREYQQLFADQSSLGLDAQQYSNFQKFFLQLDRAVAEQRNALREGEHKVARSRATWLEKRQETESLARLRQGLQQELARDQVKQEQQQNDDRHAVRSRQPTSL